MSCPICAYPLDDTLCRLCEHEGYVELLCGCIECVDGTRRACSKAHELCDACGLNEKQHESDLCGPCRFDEEMEARGVPVSEMVRRA